MMLDLSENVIAAIKDGTETAKLKLETKKPFKYIVLDSCVVAGIAAFAVMSNHIPSLEEAYMIIKAFGATFLLEIAVERGLKHNAK